MMTSHVICKLKVTVTFFFWFVLRTCKGERLRACKGEVSLVSCGSSWGKALNHGQLALGCLNTEIKQVMPKGLPKYFP